MVLNGIFAAAAPGTAERSAARIFHSRVNPQRSNQQKMEGEKWFHILANHL
jgi:hypothetical protein